MHHEGHAGTRPAPDLALYEQLIREGLASARSRGGAIDHVTARRMAIWLISHRQQPDFTRGLIRFAQSGTITQPLKTQLRNYARSPSYPHRPQAARLLECCPALKIPMYAAFTTPMKNRAIRAV